MDKEIPANVKAEIVAEIDAAIGRIDGTVQALHAANERRQQEANERARKIEAARRLQELAQQLGVRASITLK
jgi:hypothetical protein